MRKPAIAGSWYPDDKAALARQVDTMLKEAPDPRGQVDGGRVIALIAPHAGYVFSGKAAAAGYRLLKDRTIRRVVLLAVAHRVPFRGASVPDVTHYETPLGLVPVDQAAVSRLRKCRVVSNVESAHEREHSLEIQLPLLQRVLGGFELVPILLSRMEESDYPELAAAVAEVVDATTVVVASSDFTHRGPNYSYELPGYQRSWDARTIKKNLARLDQGSIDRVLKIDRKGLLAYAKQTGSTICGLSPIGLLLELLGRVKGAEGKVVAHYTSGDVAGDWTNTVTYVTAVFTGEWPEKSALERARSAGEKVFPLADPEKKTLLELARRSLESAVRKGAFDEGVIASQVPDSLRRKAGAFVTLKCRTGAGGTCSGRGEDLRGCMGTIPPITEIYQRVARQAAVAALEDPRFPKVTPAELKQIRVEVSVLTPPRRVASHQEIVIGRHGIILRKDGNAATFLPQVAPEQGWDLVTTLAHLSSKAGLGPDGWREGASFSVYEAIVFSEKEN